MPIRERLNMKSLILYLFILFAFFNSAARTLPPLPAPMFVDGEVSQCYPLDQSGIGSVWIDLSASFTGTMSNNLEIAFGQDADRDGELSLPETDLILGWSCGHYFLERFKASEVYEETNAGTNDIARALGWNSRIRRNGRIMSFALTNECGAAFADVLSSPPRHGFTIHDGIACASRREVWQFAMRSLISPWPLMAS